jgi:peptidyl-tRNA hydrolase, PTH2 family
MKDHETPEAIKARAEQEDPIVMYLIVHESLNMSTGKTAAQCAHASQMLTLAYFDLKDDSRKLTKQLMEKKDSVTPETVKAWQNLHLSMARQISIFGEWISSSFRKVVLRASDKEWAKVKEEFKATSVMVVDAGLTEIAAGSETVIGLWPMRKSQRSKMITRLQVLK